MNEGREKKFRSHILAGIFFQVLLIWIMSINQWNPKGFLTIGAFAVYAPGHCYAVRVPEFSATGSIAPAAVHQYS